MPQIRSDALVVRTAELAKLLREFIAEFNEEHEDPHRHAFQSVENAASKFIIERVNEIRRSQGEDEITWDSIYRSVVLERTKWTGLSKADLILTAIRDNIALVDGRVRVVPNPLWSNETFAQFMADRGCAWD